MKKLILLAVFVMQLCVARSQADGVYLIVHVPTGKVLDASAAVGESNIRMPILLQSVQKAASHPAKFQQWRIKKVGSLSAACTIENLGLGKVLDADLLCLAENDCKVVLNDRLTIFSGDRRSQEWLLEQVGNQPLFKISNLLKPAQVLDSGTGTILSTYKAGNSVTQQWKLIKISS